MLLIDSHCHIDQLNYHTLHKNINDVLRKAYHNNIKKFLTVSTSLKNFYEIQALVQHNDILYSCGIHPLNCHLELYHMSKIENLSKHKKVIAIGETGLDYYRTSENKNMQQHFFREHIRIANKLNKPLIIHSRYAIQDIIAILKENNSQKICKGILHSFTEDYSTASKLLDMGFYLSFSGISTFKNSFVLRETIKKIPLDRILIETDSPYLSPVPYRGKENQPAYLLEIAKNISSLKNINIEDFASITTNNFYKLFNL